MAFLYVFLGGGLGSVARFAVARSLPTETGAFPWATLIANFAACVLLGVLVAYAGRNGMADYHRHIFMVGFCGGFSTFSTFSNETLRLMQMGNYPHAFANIFISLLVGLLGVYIGQIVGAGGK